MRLSLTLILSTSILLTSAACTDDGGAEEAAGTEDTGEDTTTDTGTEDTTTDTGTETTDTGTGTSETETDTGTSTTAAETETETETETTSGAECHEFVSWCYDNPFEPFTCDSPTPCEGLEVDDPSLNGFGEEGEEPISFVNPDAATCIMEALRDAEVGFYTIRVEPGQQYSRRHNLEVLSNGTVIRRTVIFDDKCADESERWEVLRDADYFQGCLDEPTPEAQLDCMVDAGTGECVAEGPCPG